jgi:hypothetical protein
MKERTIELARFMMDSTLRAKGIEVHGLVTEFSDLLDRLLKDSDELKQLREGENKT